MIVNLAYVFSLIYIARYGAGSVVTTASEMWNYYEANGDKLNKLLTFRSVIHRLVMCWAMGSTLGLLICMIFGL